tara:strand:+ start:339 stop:1058 length:720 start_codon:yes stop_codon:yes gene_type:complete
MIDSIDVMNILETIIQPNIKMIIIIIIIIILSAKYLETNIIFIISITIYIFIYYKQIKGTFLEIKKDEKKIERVIEDNHRYKKEIHFSDELNKYLHKLKKYRKYNPQSYDEGYKYIKMFMYIIHDLEKDDITHPKQYFENSQVYLKKSLNLFQSITISVPEEKYIHSLKYNKFEQTKLSNRIGKLCKKIHNHCYYLLYNLSLRFNEDFFEKPDIYKTEINMNADQVEESNTFTQKWELY